MRWPLPPTAGALPTFALCVQTRYANGAIYICLPFPLLVAAWPCLCLRWCLPSPPPVRHVCRAGVPSSPPSAHGAHTTPPLRTDGEREATHERYAPLFFSCPRSLEQDSEQELCLPPPYMHEQGHSSTPNWAQENRPPQSNPLPLSSCSCTQSTQVGALPPLPPFLPLLTPTYALSRGGVWLLRGRCDTPPPPPSHTWYMRGGPHLCTFSVASYAC